MGVGLGHEAANAAAITFQLAPPGFEICPQNCHNHGKCRDVDSTKGTGKCKCNPGYSDDNCGGELLIADCYVIWLCVCV